LLHAVCDDLFYQITRVNELCGLWILLLFQKTPPCLVSDCNASKS
jgi:hypothetical protein